MKFPLGMVSQQQLLRWTLHLNQQWKGQAMIIGMGTILAQGKCGSNGMFWIGWRVADGSWYKMGTIMLAQGNVDGFGYQFEGVRGWVTGHGTIWAQL